MKVSKENENLHPKTTKLFMHMTITTLQSILYVTMNSKARGPHCKQGANIVAFKPFNKIAKIEYRVMQIVVGFSNICDD